MPRITLALCFVAAMAGFASLSACSPTEPVNPVVEGFSRPTIKSLTHYAIFTHDHLPEGVTVEVHDHTQEGVYVLRVATFRHSATRSVLVLGLDVGDIRFRDRNGFTRYARVGHWEITRMMGLPADTDTAREINELFDAIKRSIERHEADTPIYW